MEFSMCFFAFCMTLIPYLCSETAAYEGYQPRDRLQILEDRMYFMRKDITTLFGKTDQLNMSAVEVCGLCISGNKTSYPPVMGHDGRKDMVNVNSNNVFVKYRSLIKAFVTEKKVNRDLRNRLRSVENIISVSKMVADERDRKIQSRLLSMENIISDLHNNINLIDVARELNDKDRDRGLKDQLRSIKESIEDKISDIYRDLHNMTSFMNTISDKVANHLQKAKTTSVKPDINIAPTVKKTCKSVPESGVYTFYLELIMSPVTVYCDQDTDGGGWIVFMRRQDGAVNFDRSWSDYKHGFGSPDGEFWAGNKFLHKMTKARPMQLRIDMEDFDGNTAFAMYEEFQIGDEKYKYRLHMSGYTGTAGDSILDTRPYSSQVGMQFATFDSDNRFDCAVVLGGGWWYSKCGMALLNGPYSHEKTIERGKGIIWYSWKGWEGPLKRVEMKIR